MQYTLAQTSIMLHATVSCDSATTILIWSITECFRWLHFHHEL